MMTRLPHNPRGQETHPGGSPQLFFDPQKSDTELFDRLAEEQAQKLEVNSSQLRRFFGELKDLFRQWRSVSAGLTEEEREQRYRQEFEPRFKMIRSKVSYATRVGGQSKLDKSFAEFLKHGINKTNSWRDFERFIMHVEAVVGFMYGLGRVKDARR
ncbi:MAG: type III-A CRISPR-associated protein Csm2 [Thermogutta sp.]